MIKHYTFAELPNLVGHEMGVSDWVVIDQHRVDLFAEATGDNQWIHTDVERATREIGGPIAHGYLTVSLIPWLARQAFEVSGVSRVVNYGSDKVRFANMVRVGKRVRLRQSMQSCEPRAGGLFIVWDATIEIEDERRPACTAETITLVFGTEGRVRASGGAAQSD
jgi:acyl dehydratase